MTALTTTAPPEPDRTAETVDLARDDDIVEVWGRDSFPASDPPANW